MEDPEDKLDKLTTKEVHEKLFDILQSRGRKSMDRKTYQKRIEFWLDAVRTHKHGRGAEVFLLSQQIVFEFDSYSGAWFEHMTQARWESALEKLQQVGGECPRSCPGMTGGCPGSSGGRFSGLGVGPP